MDWKPRIDLYLPGEVRQNRLGPIVEIFTAGQETYIAYGALAGIVLCDRQLHYIRTLRIQDAFPSRGEARIWHIHGLRCITDGHGAKITAWSGKQAVVWKLKSEKVIGDVCSIWTSITVEQDINYAEYRENHLVIGTEGGVRLFKNTGDTDVPAWTVLHTFHAKQVSKCCLSPSAAFVAWYTTNGAEVYVAGVTSGKPEERTSLAQSLPHRRKVTDVFWRDSNGQDDFYLYTITVDGAFRLFTVMEDDPTWFQLVASGSTLDPAQIQADLRQQSSSGSSRPPCQPFVAFGVNEFLSLKACKNVGSRRDEDAIGHDHVFWFNREGKLFRNILRGLSRRPPRAISSSKISSTKSIISSEQCSNDLKVICCSPSRDANYIDMVIAATGETSDQLSHVRISLISGEILHSTNAVPNDSVTSAASVFQHLPMAGLRSDNGRVIFEDEKHLHAVESRSRQGHLFQVRSFSKTKEEVAQYIDLGRGSISGVLALTPTKCEFHPSQQSKVASFTSQCPSALGNALYSGTPVKYALGCSSRDYATMYLFHFSATPAPQIWRIKVSATERGLSISQLEASRKRKGAERVNSSAYDHVHIVSKAGIQKSPGDLHSFRLTCVRKGEVDRFDLSVEGKDFDLVYLDSLQILPDGLQQVSMDGFGKIAAVNNAILRIWDVASSSFGSGLEYVSDTGQTVSTCAFSTDEAHMLAFACGSTVAVITPATYGRRTRWELVFTVDLPLFSVTAITNLAWVPGNSLFVTNAVQALVLSDVLDDHGHSINLVDVVRGKRAPLPDAHPENLVQCVIWDKFSLVKLRLEQISLALKEGDPGDHIDLGSIDVELYTAQAKLSENDADPVGNRYQNRLKTNNSLWQSLLSSLTASEAVLQKLTRRGLYKLSLQDIDTLASLARTMSYAEEQAQALDANGRRYLLAVSGNASRNRKISHAEATWALHSQSKVVNLQTVISRCQNELILWSDVKRYKLSYWLEDLQITELAEILARNHFVTEGRNPIPTSIYYFALRKPKTVWGLWRQVAGHPERGAMLKFLQNNFDDPRWQTAAVKNAYALLGKQRFQYAAAFFLLGECPKDAIHVCIKQLQDYDLAIFIARIRHDRGILLPWIIETYVQPKAVTTDNKWLSHWCYWVQGNIESAIRVLYTPAANTSVTDKSPSEDEYRRNDAATMAVLLSDFKSRAETKTLCATVVPLELEMNIVRYSSSRLRAIGCEALALSVIKNWHFTLPPQTKVRDTNSKPGQSDNGSAEQNSTISPLEARPIPRERSAVASVIAPGPAQDSNETQGAMEFDMGAFF